ncbi:MAG: hypothetical protein AAGL24_25920 [Pseudomonadota bacterium]
MTTYHSSNTHGTGVTAGFNTVERIAQDLQGRSTEFRKLSEDFSKLGFVREMLELSKVRRQGGM